MYSVVFGEKISISCYEKELHPAPSSLFVTSKLIPSALLTHRMALAHSTMFSTRAGRSMEKGMEATATTFRLT